jgi:putative flippase GtrA
MPGAIINTALKAFRCKFAASLLRHRFVRFSIVGGVGFLIEATLLTYFATVPGIGAIKGRAISFPIAVVTTWWLNRTLTFQSTNNPHRESFRYFLVQSLGSGRKFGSVFRAGFGISAAIDSGCAVVHRCNFRLLVNFNLSKIRICST